MSLILGVFLATLGYQHRVWSRAYLTRRIDDPRPHRRDRFAARRSTAGARAGNLAGALREGDPGSRFFDHDHDHLVLGIHLTVSPSVPTSPAVLLGSDKLWELEVRCTNSRSEHPCLGSSEGSTSRQHQGDLRVGPGCTVIEWRSSVAIRSCLAIPFFQTSYSSHSIRPAELSAHSKSLCFLYGKPKFVGTFRAKPKTFPQSISGLSCF